MGVTKMDNWNADLYDNNHAFVSKFGEGLVELLVPQSGETILDLGCGTGDLASVLHHLGVKVIGIDQSENMIEQAKRKYPELQFDVQDALHLPYQEEFDAVFSNAVLHWIKEPSQVLSGIYSSLKPGGRFVAEFGGKGNVQRIIDELMKQLFQIGINDPLQRFPFYYPSIGEYTTLMENTGFRVVFAQHFDRPTMLEGDNGLRNWIEMFCGALFEGVTDDIRHSIITKAEHNLKPILYRDGVWYADYKRIRVIGIKE
ncbi:class I SAM-dependent methyltransferase [Neobacillus dielmonensis]|uniref:class I SAM-dependent methyltransferase n=1 Tax=Neobacillus dielmonensis TaxID=1347369 RepID=UPI0005A6DCED|nr:class I SAM-dependent methyltransferase [Neobacillus dielmonensis]